ncbi:hypothetical protein GGI25_000291 [Coemansia spiralis]|uniref:Uncharacterized protein n=2 Tax=Coemansia TaxID=4863 RepID=A0A9W8GCZ6_9FUNG|nr:nucleoside transporter-domain-containing protein [Coemansia spiralis]KAJ1995833.1 hypothetical protein EDC05_000491 [Coemansia umbellata]KAJ2625863.1 hypothetical protein GGI26_000326 [Coemansia sp. RSA 1358]KAJ2680985.1 hypothetical protein GGI25_000291 [Coemansia spiralis]
MLETQWQRYLYWRFVALGTATLMAWNVYIVSSEFFRYEFRNTPLKDNFESVFSMLSNSVYLAALSYTLYTQPKANHDRRIRVGLQATLAAFCAILLLPACGIDGWAALVVALLALSIAAVATAYIQCSIYGIVALLPPCCAEGFMSGQAVAGTVISAAQLLAIYTSPNADNNATAAMDLDNDGNSVYQRRLRLRTAAYFCMSVLFMALSATAWVQLNACLGLKQQGNEDEENEQTIYEHQALSTGTAEGTHNVNMLITDVCEESPRLRAALVEQNGSPTSSLYMGSRRGQNRQNTHILTESTDRSATNDAAIVEHTYYANPTSNSNSTSPAETPQWLAALGLDNVQVVYSTFREISPYAFICAIAMTQTLAVFPPLTEAIVSSPASKPQIGNLTAWHFLLFNMGDYLGRLSTQWIKCEASVQPASSCLSAPRVLCLVNGARWVLAAAFLLFPTNANITPFIPAVIHSDVLYLFLVFVLGWSNGWVATTALITGPQAATNKELAGSILGYALCIGLFLGAVVSYPVILVSGIS